LVRLLVSAKMAEAEPKMSRAARAAFVLVGIFVLPSRSLSVQRDRIRSPRIPATIQIRIVPLALDVAPLFV
jgi:hypothetical protein